MTHAIGPEELSRLADLAAQTAARTGARAPAADGHDFKTSLLQTLDEVNRLQMEAGERVEQLATGESQNVAEVLSAVRKADVAFSLLMEMRNKLVDAYRELQQMRI